MGILAPLFLAGLAALSVPLILHLVRATPRGKQEFSSLMFLSPTPPRLTRRSRFDQILLLLLRLTALALLAFAFTRPFLRESSLLTINELPKRRVAILLDISASMRRGDLWQQAVRAAEKQLNELAPHDDVALFTYSDRLQTIVPFPNDQVTAGESAIDIARSELQKLKPSWQIGNLGLAISTLASELDTAQDVQQSSVEPQIVVISDFQKGTRLDALTAYEWPNRVRIIPQPVALKGTTNANVQLLVNREDGEDGEPRIRVANATDSQGDQFFVRWGSEKNDKPGEEASIYVPPGESRVLKLPRPAGNLLADRVVLRGDDQDFDNVYYVVPPRKQEVKLAYLGDDQADDPQGLLYYLQLACSGDPLRQVNIQAMPKGVALTAASDARLFVVTRLLSAGEQTALKNLLEQGRVALLAPSDDQASAILPALFDDLELLESKPVDEDAFVLLGELDFTHPLFAPLAGPRYNDFTKIHFWRHRSVALKPESKTIILARFDDGEPWLLSRAVGAGQLLALTSSWSPDDSQLAVSSKFVPLMGNLLDLACGSTKPLEGIIVGDAVPLVEAGEAAEPATEPGIFRRGSADNELTYAVNLSPAESDTAPLSLEELDQLGVRRTAEVSLDTRLTRLRQERDTELEGRQKVWRWLLVGCLLFLIGETLWAGMAARPAAKPLEVAA